MTAKPTGAARRWHVRAARLLKDCGDGIIDSSEQCDDGNNDDGDGRPANCEREAPTGIPLLPSSALILLGVLLLLGSSFGILGRRLDGPA